MANYELLKIFVEETIALKGHWTSPGGSARKFMFRSGLIADLVLWKAEFSSDLSNALTKVSKRSVTLKNATCVGPDKLTKSPLAGKVFLAT